MLVIPVLVIMVGLYLLLTGIGAVPVSGTKAQKARWLAKWGKVFKIAGIVVMAVGAILLGLHF